jgi:spore maturation protein CgeB
VLSENMKAYQSASYQADVLQEIQNQTLAYFYGPGFPNHNSGDTIADVFHKCPFEPDALIVGHSWLLDVEGIEVNRQPSLSLKDISIPKCLILNKEYLGIEEKLKYIKRERFDIVFSHQEQLKSYQERTNTPFVFSPFAVDKNMMLPPEQWATTRENTLFFSGILQNSSEHASQSDIRIRVMNQLFFTARYIPIAKKRAVRKQSIFWNSFPRSQLQWWDRLLLKVPHKYAYRQMTRNEYISALSNSIACVNSLSPMGLVSPRYFEAMGCGAVVFCEESGKYKNLFPRDLLVTFKPDLSDFFDKLEYIVREPREMSSLRLRAYEYVLTHHTWQERVSGMLRKVIAKA